MFVYSVLLSFVTSSTFVNNSLLSSIVDDISSNSTLLSPFSAALLFLIAGNVFTRSILFSLVTNSVSVDYTLMSFIANCLLSLFTGGSSLFAIFGSSFLSLIFLIGSPVLPLLSIPSYIHYSFSPSLPILLSQSVISFTKKELFDQVFIT